MSQLFTSGGQSIGASASASVLPMNIQGSIFKLMSNELMMPSNIEAREFIKSIKHFSNKVKQEKKEKNEEEEEKKKKPVYKFPFPKHFGIFTSFYLYNNLGKQVKIYNNVIYFTTLC